MNKKINEWAKNNGINRKELATKGGISQASLSTFISGKTKTNSDVIEAWAKEWPQMICYALELHCEEKIEFDDEDNRFWIEKFEIIERLEKLEKSVFESEESQKNFVDSVS